MNGRNLFVLGLVATVLAVLAFPAVGQITARVSIDSAGTEGDDFSSKPSTSADGRWVAFESDATNLVVGDTNGFRDIFVHDRTTGATTRVSIDSAGTEGDGFSSDPSLSGDGLFVAFESDASNLVAGDTNGSRDAFVHDRMTGATARVSIDSAGAQGNGSSFDTSISGDGLFVAFDSFASNLVAGDTNGFFDIFVHDRTTGETTRVSVDSAGAESNGSSFVPWLSADGQSVAFDGLASNLVAGDTNGLRDIFVHDRMTGETTRVSVDSAGMEGDDGSSGSSLSADGRFVAFGSQASNLVADDINGFRDIFVHDRGPPPECFLVIGDGLGSSTFFEISHLFETQVGPTVEDSYAVLLDSIPEFVLPTPATTARKHSPSSSGLGFNAGAVARDVSMDSASPPWMLDGQLAVQVLMWNPKVFPGLPEQYTAGLFVSVQPDGTVLTVPYGTDVGGLQIWHEIDTNAAGQKVIRFPFSIPGL